MQYLLLVYVDDSMIEALPDGEYDRRMRHCLERADALQDEGTVLGFQQLEPAPTAKSVRRRAGKVTVVDGPFAETKEMLAGFNLVEADSLEDAIRMAEELPWAETGCIEVRAVRNVDAVRARVGAPRRPAAA
ncbi:YciI family protein [uncultured Luteimonas sp.]|uniref:YciI family protein n=1 Tax=uncultured Luteimonas sp. TaxID=453144 RepID=UPI00261C85D2|nr:YciI family protein [uncultured Luteimonas sp.]